MSNDSTTFSYRDDPRWQAAREISIDEDAGVEAWMTAAVVKYMIEAGAVTPDDMLAEAQRHQRQSHERKILADLLRPSNKGLRRIDQGDVDDVLDGVRRIGGAA